MATPKKKSAFEMPEGKLERLKWNFDPSVAWAQFTEGLAGGPATDYEAVAQQDAFTAKEDAERAFRMNNPTVEDPFGETVTIIDGSGNVKRRTTLNPADQQRLDANRKLGLGLLDQGQSLLGQKLDLNGLPGLQYGNPLNFGDKLNQLESGDAARQRAENALFQRASARLDPMWGKREAQLQTQLANQGLDPTSEAYRSAMQDFSMGRNDAYSSAMNDAITRGGDEASRLFGMGLAGNNQILANNAQQFGFGLQANDQRFGQSLAGRQQGVGEQMDAQRYGISNLGMGLNILGATGQFNMPQAPWMPYQTPGQPNLLGAAQLGNAEEQARSDAAFGVMSLPFQIAGMGANVGKAAGGLGGLGGGGSGVTYNPNGYTGGGQSLDYGQRGPTANGYPLYGPAY